MTDTPIIEEVNYCAVHTEREASLRCIRCERYMCTQCVVQSPVGYICKQCAHQHDKRFFTATSTDDIIVFATTAIMTGIGAAIVNATGIPFFFFLLFGLPIGGFVSEVALRLTKRRRGRYSHWIGVAGSVIGGLAGVALQGIQFYNSIMEGISRAEAAEAPSLIEFLGQWVFNQWGALIFIAIIAFAVYGRYKMRV